MNLTNLYGMGNSQRMNQTPMANKALNPTPMAHKVSMGFNGAGESQSKISKLDKDIAACEEQLLVLENLKALKEKCRSMGY